MERSNSSRSTNSSFSTTSRVSSSSSVLSIQCLKGSSKSDEWTENMLQTGDIVESLRLGNMILKSPFKNGKNGIQKIMHTSFKAKETSICVRVRRGSDESFTELQVLKSQYFCLLWYHIRKNMILIILCLDRHVSFRTSLPEGNNICLELLMIQTMPLVLLIGRKWSVWNYKVCFCGWLFFVFDFLVLSTVVVCLLFLCLLVQVAWFHTF